METTCERVGDDMNVTGGPAQDQDVVRFMSVCFEGLGSTGCAWAAQTSEGDPLE